ncbi:serine/threonine-protein kinase [Thermopolyspora sp. NPDC052614]|uniref:serine/threonine-protein kinase n=1 Tax=Thermopolyspora sp. NPDC052614 TaxID=3155682 RepID=UPI00341CD967
MMAHAAYRLRSQNLWIFAAGYGAVVVGGLAASGALQNVPTDDWRRVILSVIWFFVLCLGGTVHLFTLRRQVFGYAAVRQMPPPPPPTQAHQPTQVHQPTHATTGPAAFRWIGPYALLTKIGEGGQGSVFLARTPQGQQVAVKVLHARVGPGEREGFLAEASAARRVPSYCTARVIDVGVDDGVPYIVSEYVRGPSLDQLVRREGPLHPDSLTRLAISTAAALNGIHGAGIVHRDFKPANVLLAPDGPRVIDFGIARAIDRFTTSGASKGTPAFMSPEQFHGGQVGPASDIFSWGSTLYFAATGRLAFDGPAYYQVANQIMYHSPDLSAVPGQLREVVAACLYKNPGDRPSAEQLLITLSR